MDVVHARLLQTRIAHPVWTKAQLRRTLIACCGSTGAGGGVNEQAVADYLQVSTRSVRRWTHGDGRTKSSIGVEHLDRLRWPGADELRREVQRVDYARRALDQVADGKVNGAWRERDWLRPWALIVIDLPYLRQVTVSGESHESISRLYRRGIVTEYRLVPTYFDAVIGAGAILSAVHQWRVQPIAGLVRGGTNQCWSTDAPPLRLTVRRRRVRGAGAD